MRERPIDVLARTAYEAATAEFVGRALTWPEQDEATRRTWHKGIDALMRCWLDMPRAQSAYYDPREAVRLCDECDQPYRGPAVYCCHSCALDAAAG
jgi:hypothetical protein